MNVSLCERWQRISLCWRSDASVATDVYQRYLLPINLTKEVEGFYNFNNFNDVPKYLSQSTNYPRILLKHRCPTPREPLSCYFCLCSFLCKKTIQVISSRWGGRIGKNSRMSALEVWSLTLLKSDKFRLSVPKAAVSAWSKRTAELGQEEPQRFWFRICQSLQ